MRTQWVNAASFDVYRPSPPASMVRCCGQPHDAMRMGSGRRPRHLVSKVLWLKSARSQLKLKASVRQVTVQSLPRAAPVPESIYAGLQ